MHGFTLNTVVALGVGDPELEVFARVFEAGYTVIGIELVTGDFC